MPKPVTFTPDSLFKFVTAHPEFRRIWIAFSGGMDSHVLLRAFADLKDRLNDVELQAVHIDHGLNEKSEGWSQQCQQVCKSYDIPVKIIRVDARHNKGESPEAAARHARYDAFKELLKEGDCVVTAHHQDDQAETLLLQLARGCGPAGLASMPMLGRFHSAWLARPLLNFTREQLSVYAQDVNLQWIEDPSNFDIDFDRNFVRHTVMPAFKQRWPQIVKTISRSALHNAEVSQLLEQLAEIDLQQLQGEHPDTLSVSALKALGEARRNNAIRIWIKKLGLPLPQAVHLKHINHDILLARKDAQPAVNWAGCVLSRYRDQLYAMRPLPSHDNNQLYQWDMQRSLTIPNIGTLSTKSVTGSGLRYTKPVDNDASNSISIRFRQGGEQCQPSGRAHTHDLKKLFQEFDVPFWARDRIPLVYVNNTLAGIVGYCYCQDFVAGANETGYEIRFQACNE